MYVFIAVSIAGDVLVYVQVQASLKHLAARRTDIFGREETHIGQKVKFKIFLCVYLFEGICVYC